MDIASLLTTVELILAPLNESEPAGVSLRYDPIFPEIRTAREADDPSLPQGEWERPLKKSDWPLVAGHCSQLLQERSKDLQLASWLTEAWIHLYQLDGLQAGVAMLSGLLEQHWEGLHPRLDDDGDSEARVAPLVWLNETLPLTLRLHVGLMNLPDRKPSRVSLEDWIKAPLASTATSPPSNSDGQPALSRDDLVKFGSSTGTQDLLIKRQHLRAIMSDWKKLDDMVDQKLGTEAPSLSRVQDAMAQMDRMVTSLLAGRAEPAPVREATSDNPDNDAVTTEPGIQAEPVNPPPAQLKNAAAILSGGVIASRSDAYLLLEVVADYLQNIEPHSPTPYLIRRAVTWGNMPLPQLMQEVLREEGDLNRLFTVLGIAQTN
jgi:type VI secretion system protein ImpA